MSPVRLPSAETSLRTTDKHTSTRHFGGKSRLKRLRVTATGGRGVRNGRAGGDSFSNPLSTVAQSSPPRSVSSGETERVRDGCPARPVRGGCSSRKLLSRGGRLPGERSNRRKHSAALFTCGPTSTDVEKMCVSRIKWKIGGKQHMHEPYSVVTNNYMHR